MGPVRFLPLVKEQVTLSRTYTYRRQDVSVDVESSLVYSGGKGWIQALGQPLRDGQLVRDHLKGRITL